jgi:hypothetical protein
MAIKLELSLKYNKELGVDLPVRLALINLEAAGMVSNLTISYHDKDKSVERTVLRIDSGPAFHKEEGRKRILKLIADKLEDIE